MREFWHITFVFWVIMDAVGSIPIYVSTLNQFDPPRQRKIIMREMLIALTLMVLFLFFGEGFFKLLQVDTSALQIAGGIILFLIAIRLLMAKSLASRRTTTKEPLIVPLAVPCVAGPGILATISLYSGLTENYLLILCAVIAAWLLSVPFLLLSSFFKQILGENGLVAVERLFGYLIALLAMDMAVKGFLATFK